MSKQLRPIGRMIRRDLADDEGMAKLSDGASRLYFYLYPHLDSYGKWAGGPGTIQETIVPLLDWSRKRILSYLAEINSHTSVKVWTHRGRFYAHDERFFEKQDIREDRRGQDRLPTYPGADRIKPGTFLKSLPEYVPDLLPHELEVGTEEEGEAAPRPQKAGAPAPEDEEKLKGMEKEIKKDIAALRGGALGAPPAAASESVTIEEDDSERAVRIKRSQVAHVVSEFQAGNIDYERAKGRLQIYGIYPDEINKLMRTLSLDVGASKGRGRLDHSTAVDSSNDPIS